MQLFHEHLLETEMDLPIHPSLAHSFFILIQATKKLTLKYISIHNHDKASYVQETEEEDIIRGQQDKMGCTVADKEGSFVFFRDMVNVNSAVASPAKTTYIWLLQRLLCWSPPANPHLLCMAARVFGVEFACKHDLSA